jgi:tetratricopeptide (TPR) repeat protein
LVVFWWQRGHLNWRRDVLPLIPWFVFAGGSGLFTAWVERKIIGAEGVAFNLTLVQRCLLAGRVAWFYVGKLFWPSDLVFMYPRWDVKSAAGGWVGYIAAAAIVTWALWVYRKRSRGPLAAWLFFVGSLFPALGFFNVYPFLFSYVADHFQYLASLGIFTAIGAGAALFLARASVPGRAAGLAIVGSLVATLAFLSNAQSRTYADATTLYKVTIERNPDCWMAHNNLGVIYADHGDLVSAVAEYKEAIRLKTDYAEAQDNLGVVLLKIPDRLNEAVAHFQEALRLDPEFAAAHNNLANALMNFPGRLDDAVAEYQEAIRLKHDYAAAYDNLGGVLLKMPNRLNEAIANLHEALLLKPDLADAHDNLGIALGDEGRDTEAIAEFKEALRLKPDFVEAHNNLGQTWLKMPERIEDAAGQFEEALRLNPNDAEAHNNLGIAFVAKGRIDEGVAQYKEALRLKPSFSDIHFNIAMAILNVPGRRHEAAEQLEVYLLIKPENAAARRILAQIKGSNP